MNHWSANYLGLPYRDLGRDRSGLDCWGLVVQVYADVAGIELPSYVGEYASALERQEVSALVGKGRQNPYWRQLGKSAIPQPMDLVVFTRGNLDTHVGVLVWPGHMLHVSSGRTSCIEPIDGFPWSTRPRFFGRHVRMEGRAL